MRIGIIGAGGIAVSMADTVAQMSDVTIEAVASRSIEKAVQFSKKHSIVKAYGSYLELVQDPAIDLVYVATVHSSHYENVKLCLENGKNVLCEKAFMMNAEETRQVIELAKEKNLLLAEAIWTRYMPSRKMIRDLVTDGTIGKVTSLTANLGYVVGHNERMKRPELGGGALLDLAVYPINFALMAFGDDYDSFSADAVMADTGVDAMDSITLKWKDGRCAVLHANMQAALDRLGCIYGDQGYIIIQNINNCEKITVYNSQHQIIREIPVPKQITGYEYEVEACKRALEEGKTECDEMPLADSLKVMELLDAIRNSWEK